MNRIEATLTEAKEKNQKILSPYITAGDPHPKLTVQLMHALVDAGATILELGIPFSDPMAEGVVIQQAMERALTYSISIVDVLHMVQQFRQKDKKTPIVLMGYLNPIEQYGYAAFAQDAVAAGVDATILVDLPPEESDEIVALWKEHGLYSIYLCSPTTSTSRMQLIAHYGQGYLYYVSLKGVTGSDTINLDSVRTHYQQCKAQSALPVMIGFGIKTPEMAAKVASFADGVIVGAALVTAIIDAYRAGENGVQAATQLITAMRQAIDNGRNK